MLDRRKLGKEEPRYLSHQAGDRASSEEASAVPLPSSLFSSLLAPDSHRLWGNCAHPKVSQPPGLVYLIAPLCCALLTNLPRACDGCFNSSTRVCISASRKVKGGVLSLENTSTYIPLVRTVAHPATREPGNSVFDSGWQCTQHKRECY